VDGGRGRVQYAETLELVAMCIAGYSGGGSSTTSPSAAIWRRACDNLLSRPDFSIEMKNSNNNNNSNNNTNTTSRSDIPVSYLRAICTFLVTMGQDNHLASTLNDAMLSLSDRVAFACLFLPRKELKSYLESLVEICIGGGNLEGILITGLDRRGIALLQSYVDRCSDVQTAALVSSRVILPVGWVRERVICSEWLHTYREMLNTWQMWQARAIFDVGRAELLRELRDRQHYYIEESSIPTTINPSNHRNTSGGSSYISSHSSRRTPGLRKHNSYFNSPTIKEQSQLQSPSLDYHPIVSSFPPQLNARCNFCGTTLPLEKLRRQDGIANTWLSRQKPVLSCCPNPQCRKPLPRCAICLLPLGCLNPYMELRRKGLMRSSSSSTTFNNGLFLPNGGDDLSDLANLPFAEWFSWCMRCKHGGHAHHLAGWFADHDTCAVSNCDCRCQFDGIQKLGQPGLLENDGEDAGVCRVATN